MTRTWLLPWAALLAFILEVGLFLVAVAIVITGFGSLD